MIALVIVAVLIGAGVAVGVVLKVNHDNQVAKQHEEEQEEEDLARAERERARDERVEEQKERQEELKAEEALARIEAEYGHESQRELEEAITKDANGDAEEGFSEYVSKTNCEPEGGRIDTTLAAQDFNCLAVTTESGGLAEGYRYSGTINYVKGTLSWRLGG